MSCHTDNTRDSHLPACTNLDDPSRLHANWQVYEVTMSTIMPTPVPVPVRILQHTTATGSATLHYVTRSRMCYPCTPPAQPSKCRFSTQESRNRSITTASIARKESQMQRYEHKAGRHSHCQSTAGKAVIVERHSLCRCAKGAMYAEDERKANSLLGNPWHARASAECTVRENKQV